MTCKIGMHATSALLVGLLAFSCTSWNALAGTHSRKKPAVAAHAHYYLYHPAANSVPSGSHAVSDDHRLCWLPSEGCDNNHTITN